MFLLSVTRAKKVLFPLKTTLLIGQSTVFKCLVQQPVKWHFNTLTPAKSALLDDNRILLIENVTLRDAGIIHCQGRINNENSESTFQSIVEVLGTLYLYSYKTSLTQYT